MWKWIVCDFNNNNNTADKTSLSSKVRKWSENISSEWVLQIDHG